MRATFKTAKSIYKALEIEVDGKVYVCKKITKGFLKDFLEFEKSALDGDINAPYKQANFAFGVPLKILSLLDAPEIRDINTMVLQAITNAEKIEAETGEKDDPNLEKPGGSN